MLQAGKPRFLFPITSLDIFRFTESFKPHYGPGIDSATDRNEYQESSCGVKRGQSLRLTNAPSSEPIV
jgi:hypothetical protein